MESPQNRRSAALKGRETAESPETGPNLPQIAQIEPKIVPESIAVPFGILESPKMPQNALKWPQNGFTCCQSHRSARKRPEFAPK